MEKRTEAIRADMEKAVWDGYYLLARLSRISARLLREEVKVYMEVGHDQ